ncbi:UDP-galactopyranose mutase [Marinicrinis lubricantis]|uniref:UDP-galactopyranose mutase n=1 Tax=Marinicrinis lubricantis TaxID=2086470 RepID=A0ABW1IKD9_9BACL
MFDYIIVGAGFVGSTLAERLASQLNKKVLIIEQRNHIGGNAYDCYDEHGVLIHQYGPHIFHTRSKEVWDYLSQFTDWRTYQHEVLGLIDGHKVPVPFNLNSLHQLFPSSLANRLEEKLIGHFGYNVKVPILKLREVSDSDLQYLAQYVYEKVFLNYTVKQWGVKPEELDPTVTGRVPVYISRDNRYFQDVYQGMPSHGYTKMFERMLAHPNIKVMLNTDYKELMAVDTEAQLITFMNQPFEGKLIYTGPIDYFFDYKFGKLPYRSLRFQFEHWKDDLVQDVGTVNYNNNYNFTRMTEFKHLTGQKVDGSTTVKEFSQDYVPGQNDAYYPIKNDGNLELYKKYKRLGDSIEPVIFAGRLAEYQYFDMDAVVARALGLFNQLYGDVI